MKLIDADLFYDKLEKHSEWLFGPEYSELCDIQDILKDEPGINPYEWISVEDRLPKKGEEVLIYRGHHSGLMNVCTYIGDNDWEDDYGYWSRTEDEGITHWMHLPAPPTEKEN